MEDIKTKEHKLRLYINESKSNFTYQLNQTVTNVKGLKITNIKIPITYYNVKFPNNILNINYDNVAYNITLSEGNYNIDSLLTEIKSKVDQQINQNLITFTLNQTTGRIEIRTNDPTKFIEVIANELSKKIGFTRNSNLLQIIFSDSIVDLLNDSIYILLENVHLNAEVNGNLYSILYKANVNTSPFSIFYDDNLLSEYIDFKTPLHLNCLYFKIVDQNFDLIEFNNSEFEFQITLKHYDNEL